MRRSESLRDGAGDSFLACLTTNACAADLAAAANRLAPSAEEKALANHR